MSQSARVESLDALKEFKAALIAFGVDVQEALAAVETEIQRSLDNLQQQLQHWHAEVRRRQDELVRAKAVLAQKRWGHSHDRGPGQTEAEMAVEHAKQRLREAEAKVEITRRWLLHLPREIGEYQGPARRLGGWVEADLKQGVALLDRRLAALEAYAAPPPAPAEGQP